MYFNLKLKIINNFIVYSFLINDIPCFNATTSMGRVGANLILSGESLGYVNTTEFLGMTLDSKLQWGPHIRALAGKLSSAAYADKKMKQLTDVDTTRIVYHSYFHSEMFYGILIWRQAADIETIFILQKRAIRTIYNLGSRMSLREKFTEVNIFTVPSQYTYECLVYVRANLTMFARNSDQHEFHTRITNKLAIPEFHL